jgi:hypothetical protein
MVIATSLGWGNVSTIALAVALAFPLGYSFTLWALLGAGLSRRRVLSTALASDSLDLGHGDRGQRSCRARSRRARGRSCDGLFWWSLALSFVLAFAAALPLNRWLIARGRGHVLVHAH